MIHLQVRLKQPAIPTKDVKWIPFTKLKLLNNCYINVHYELSSPLLVKGSARVLC